MFGLVSKRKYRELEERCRGVIEDNVRLECTYSALKEKHSALESERMKKELGGIFWKGMANSYKAMRTATLEENRELTKELQEYKQKYADELQKRLELAERVKRLEGE